MITFTLQVIYFKVSYNKEYQSFLDFLKYEKRYANHTLLAYERDLKSFFDYLDETYEVNHLPEVSAVMIRSWLAHLKDKNISPRSINRKLSALRSCFKFLTRTGAVSNNPVSALQGLKSAKRLPVYIERQGMDYLLHGVDFSDDFPGHTERLILELLYETGMRRAELMNLKVQDLDDRALQLKVLGKGNKERIIPVSSALCKKIKEYQSEKEKLPEFDRQALLVTPKGRKLYDKYIYRVVNKWLSVVTSADKKSPHVLRHTFATHLLNNGADLNAIKELLGHAGLAATQVYTHNSIDQLKKVYDQAHPKSGK